MSESMVDDLRGRIQNDFDHFNGQLPSSFAIAWGGYAAALYEWGRLTRDEFDRVRAMLPPVENDPAALPFLGRTDES